MFNSGMQPSTRSVASREETIVNRRSLVATFAALAAGAIAGGAPRPAAAAAASAGQDLGAVWWSELQTADLERACAFYAQTIGWTPKTVAMEDMTRPPAEGEKSYTLFTMDGREVAGAARIDDSAAQGTVASWLTYIQVADVDAAILKTVELGGKLVEPALDVPNAGRIAVVQDPEGVRIGLITPAAA